MSSKGFNLVNDPWIPVEDGHVSIKHALMNAHQIDGWPCSDPAFAEALMRLLVPMVYRITGMDDPGVSRYEFAARQRDFMSAGRFDATAVSQYLSTHQPRFWLVNPPASCTPFAQDPSLAAAAPKLPSKAVTSWASGNNPTLGPHADCDSVSAAMAAQQLITLRCYSTGGLYGKHPRHSGKGKFVGAPLRDTTCVHPVGKNFALTLIAHLLPLPNDTEFKEPFWETDVVVGPADRYSERSGLLEQIAGRSDKTMLLRADQHGDITGFNISEGPGVASDLFCPDPYRLTDHDGAKIKPREGRTFWREAESLLGQSDAGQRLGHIAIVDWAISPDGWENYQPADFSWAAVSHRGDKGKELAWVCSHAPSLLSIFEPETALRCHEFLSAAADAEKQMATQVAKARHAMDLMPGSPKLKSAVYAPARATFWGLAESDFWETADGRLSAEQRDGRLRSHALAGYDEAMAAFLRDRRTLDKVLESRRWIDRWRRQPTQPTGKEAE